MEKNYLIISGTNRAGSNTHKIALQYKHIFAEAGIDVPVLSLENLEVHRRTDDYIKIEQEILIPAQKIIFISPEYNGSFPGVLKSMIDISNHSLVWWGKKALLTGISSGRAGNLRGMEHLTGILHYLKVNVHHNKLPISQVDRLLNGCLTIYDPVTIKAITHQVNEFIQF